MGFDGSGGYNRTHNWVTDKNAGIKITASRMDAEFDDFASAMELCLLKDGQQNPTANLPMNSKKHTGVAAASSRTEYVDGATLQDGGFIWAGVASGASAIALSLTPTITAYTTGMRIGFIAAGDNASAVTINVDGVSAAAGVKGKNEALVATDIVSGGAYWITYKGANGFQFGNPLEENPTFTTLTTTGLATIGSLTVTSAVTLPGFIETGTVMLFFQAAAPTGWTQVAANNDTAIRMVSGTGGGTGGTVAFETAFASQAVAGTNTGTAITEAQMPAHTHALGSNSISGAGGSVSQTTTDFGDISTKSTGGGDTHTHTFTGTAIDLDVAYINVIQASKD